MTDTITIPREQLQRMVSAIGMLIPTLPGLNDKGRTWLRDEIIESTDALRAALEQTAPQTQEKSNDHKLVPLRPPESILAVVRKAYGNATAYDVGHVWHEIYTRLPDAAQVQEPQPVAYLMKHGQWSTNIETDEGMWLLEQFPSEDVQIPVYLAAQSPQGCEADSLHSRK